MMHAVTDAPHEWITLARVIKTQGRRGEVAIELHTDVPNRFQRGMRMWALAKSGSRRELTVEDLWPHKGHLVLKFEGVETISDAELLMGAELQLPLAERAELEPGWTYLNDLIGCLVFDCGREIGKVADVVFGAGEAPLLVVRDDVRDNASKVPYEIPFAEAYLEKVDVGRKQIKMRLPEGLLDVNAPLTQEEKKRGR
jgi:16S rRNA processing protein RimM